MIQPEPHISFSRIVMPVIVAFLLAEMATAAPQAAPAPPASEAVKPKPAPPAEATPATPKADVKPVPPAKDTKPAAPAGEVKPADDTDDEAAAENAEAGGAAVAKPVSADPVQLYGWRENILINGLAEKLTAKLDTGALTSSIHAEDTELFERDGKKWVRFIVTDPGLKKPVRTRIEAPLVRIAKIKEPGGQSESREVVRLSFTIGERKMRGEFTLNNRTNMLSPVLIGRNMIKDLGWVDPARIHLADQKIFR